MSLWTRFLALLCRCCPVCRRARKHPDSDLAAKLREVEKNCPACRAYARVYGCPAHGTPTPKDTPS